MIELISLVYRQKSAAGCESVLPTLTKCVLPDRYNLNQLSDSSLIP